MVLYAGSVAILLNQTTGLVSKEKALQDLPVKLFLLVLSINRPYHDWFGIASLPSAFRSFLKRIFKPVTGG